MELNAMKKFGWGVCVALVCGTSTAGAQSNPQQSLTEVERSTEAISASLNARLAAIQACNAQGMFWTATGCTQPEYMNIEAKIIDASVKVGKCNDGCRGNGHKGTTCNVYDVYQCPTHMTPGTSKVQVEDTPHVGPYTTSQTITVTTCHTYKNLVGHNKDRHNGPCPF
jgi:hypothetical protein